MVSVKSARPRQGEINTSCDPSGDQEGWQAPFSMMVSWVRSVLSALTRYSWGMPERVEANTIWPVPPPSAVASGAGRFSFVGVDATVGRRVWVGSTAVAVAVDETTNGVTVGNCPDVGMSGGSEGTAVFPQLKGRLICIRGVSRFVICGGTISGRSLANATIARESRSIV